jgi:hypothetical protein
MPGQDQSFELTKADSNYVSWASSQLDGTNSGNGPAAEAETSVARSRPQPPSSGRRLEGYQAHRQPPPTSASRNHQQHQLSTAGESPDESGNASDTGGFRKPPPPTSRRSISGPSDNAKHEPPIAEEIPADVTTLPDGGSSTSTAASGFQKPLPPSLEKLQKVDSNEPSDVEDTSSTAAHADNNGQGAIAQRPLPPSGGATNMVPGSKSVLFGGGEPVQTKGGGNADTAAGLVMDDVDDVVTEEMSATWTSWLYNYTQDTTMHGISYVTRRTRFVFRRYVDVFDSLTVYLSEVDKS